MKEMGPESAFAWPVGFAWVMCLSGFNAGKGNHSKHVKQKEMKHRKLGAFPNHWKGWRYRSGSSFGRMFGFKVTSQQLWCGGQETARNSPATAVFSPWPPCKHTLGELCCCSHTGQGLLARQHRCRKKLLCLLRFVIFMQERLTAEPKLHPEPQPHRGLGMELLAFQLRDMRRNLEEADCT